MLLLLSPATLAAASCPMRPVVKPCGVVRCENNQSESQRRRSETLGALVSSIPPLTKIFSGILSIIYRFSLAPNRASGSMLES
jgi:hypothetical protein